MIGSLAVNGRFLVRRPTGVDRFALELLTAIDMQLEREDALCEHIAIRVVLPADGSVAREFRNIPMIRVGRHGGQLWEQWDLPRALGHDEWLLNMCNTAPVLARKQVVAIHDAATVAVPEAFSRGFRTWYRVLMPLLGRRAHSILTVSEFSRKELVHAFRMPGGKLSVVSEGGEHILRHAADVGALDRFGLRSRPYVLAVSSMAAHKNFRLVLEALALMPDAPFDVAIAGGANAKVFGEAGHIESDQVKWLGYVSDAELRALYEGAMAFVFPSLYEGFGIPPLEAMQCGCPVLAARAASIPEVCGDAAVYFDPRSAEELAAALRRVAADPALRVKMSALGRVQSRRFSWEKGARQLMGVCRAAMERGA